MVAKRPAVEIPVKIEKNQAEKDVKQLSKNMFKSFADIKAGFDLAAKGLSVLGSALGSVNKLAKESIKLAMTQQENERKLMQAANMRGKFTRQQFKDLQKLNSETQQATGIGDEYQLQMQAQMAMMGVSNDQLVKATRATIGLSEATGSDLNSSMRIVARTLQGNTSSLKRYGIQAKDSKEAMEMLLQNFEIAKDKSKTLAGQLKILGANFGDLQETWGMGVAKSDRVVTAFEAINNAVLRLNNFFASQQGAKLIDVWFKRLLLFGGKTLEVFISISRQIDHMSGKTHNISAQREHVMNFAKTQITDEQAQGAGFKNANDWARQQAFRLVPETFAEVMQSLADELIATAQKPFKPGGRPIATGAGGGKPKTGATGKGISLKGDVFGFDADDQREFERNREKRIEQLDQWFAMREAKKARDKEFNDAELAQTQQFYDQLGSIALNGLGNMIAGLVHAGLSGEKSLSEVMGSMFGAMLSQVGSMLVSMGTATVMAAVASKPVPMLWSLTGGPAGVGAGLGLIAAGGVLTGVGQYVSSSGSATKAELSRVQGSARRMTPSAADRGRPGQVTEETSTVYNINFNGALPGSERRIAKEIKRIMGGGFSPAGAV